MIKYSSIFQTGVQSLLAVACGWCCGKWQVLEADPTVQYTNTLVLKFCIPCLQVWLLAIKTDMRQPGNWSALGVFLLWSVSLQLLLAVQQLLTRRQLQLAKLGVDSLLLTTNNTGILGPVVIQAAVGPKYAPLGMLATVVLYFQQLPSAQLLFQLDQLQTEAAVGGAAASTSDLPQHNGQHRLHKWTQPNGYQEAHSSGDLCSSMQQLELVDTRPPLPAAAAAVLTGKLVKDHASPPPLTPVSAAAAALHELSLEEGYPAVVSASAGGLQHRKQYYGSSDSLQLHYQHQMSVDQQVLCVEHSPAEGDDSPGVGYSMHHNQQQQQQQHWERGALLGKHQQQQQQQQQDVQQQSVAAMVAALLVKNSLVWSTGISLLLSCLGSSVLLDPASPLAIKQLAFLEQMLGWFAVTTAPLTLFTTGLWMYSNSAKQQGLQHQQQYRGQLGRVQQGLWHMTGDEQLPWRDLVMYMLARATVAPAVMVLLCWLLGFKGDLAHALVILALLPVAQTAFVVCKQHDNGTHAVSCVMVGSLLLMLPQLMLMLAVLEWLGLFL